MLFFSHLAFVFFFLLNFSGVLSDLIFKNGSKRGRAVKGLKVERNSGFQEAADSGYRDAHIFLRWVRLQEARRLCSHLGASVTSASPAAVLLPRSWRHLGARAAAAGLTCASLPPAPPRCQPRPAPPARRPPPPPPPPRPGPAHWLPLGGEEKGRPLGGVSLVLRAPSSAP